MSLKKELDDLFFPGKEAPPDEVDDGREDREKNQEIVDHWKDVAEYSKDVKMRRFEDD